MSCMLMALPKNNDLPFVALLSLKPVSSYRHLALSLKGFWWTTPKVVELLAPFLSSISNTLPWQIQIHTHFRLENNYHEEKDFSCERQQSILRIKQLIKSYWRVIVVCNAKETTCLSTQCQLSNNYYCNSLTQEINF